MPNKKKIIVHSLDAANWKDLIDAHIMQRGILAADEGDIVVSAVPFEPDYLKYLRDLNVLPKNVEIFAPLAPGLYYKNFLDNPELKNFLKARKNSHLLDFFLPGKAEIRLAEETGIAAFYNFKTSAFFNDKSNFRKLLRDLHLPLIDGFEFLKTPPAIVKAASELFNDGASSVFIKKSNSHTGLGNVKIEKSYFYSFPKSERRILIDTIFDYLGGANDSFVVEKYLDNIAASPAIQYICEAGGRYNVVSIHDQLFSKAAPYQGFLFEENLHSGIVFPSSVSQNTAADIIKATSKIMDYLIIHHDCVGYAGFDAAVCSDGSSFIVDPNIRRMTGLYPIGAAKKLFGPEPSFVYGRYYFSKAVIGRFKELRDFIGSVRHGSRGKIIILTFEPTRNPYLNSSYMLFAGRDHNEAASLRNIFEVY